MSVLSKCKYKDESVVTSVTVMENNLFLLLGYIILWIFGETTKMKCSKSERKKREKNKTQITIHFQS